MEIREEDRGKEKMVFEITSMKLNSVIRFCVGDDYEHSGKKRHNVYIVKNGKVHSCVGYYDTPLDEPVVDEDGKDFDVKRFKEPDWIIDHTSPLLTQKEEKEVVKPKKAPVVPSGSSEFKVIETTKGGDCFYDSVVRAQDGNDMDEFDEDKVQVLRKELADYIIDDHRQELIDEYKFMVEQISEKTVMLKDDPYYSKYYKLQENGMEEDEIVKKIKEELADSSDPNVSKNLKVDTFLTNEGTDTSPNKVHVEAVPELKAYIRDYYDNKTDLSEDDIVSTFRDHMTTMGVWVNATIMGYYEKMKNTKLLLLKKHGNRVEEYTEFEHITALTYNKNTKFIVCDYTPETHFKLIIKLDPVRKLFTWDELPSIIKNKFSEVAKAIKSPEPKAAPKVESKKKVAKEKKESKSSQPSETQNETPPEVQDESQIGTQSDSQGASQSEIVPSKYTREELNALTQVALKKILQEEFPSVPFSILKGKDSLIDCILNPKSPQCVSKRKTKSKSEKLTGGKFTRRI